MVRGGPRGQAALQLASAWLSPQQPAAQQQQVPAVLIQAISGMSEQERWAFVYRSHLLLGNLVEAGWPPIRFLAFYSCQQPEYWSTS